MIYDLLILGAGPAGYKAALRAAQKKMSVCIFENQNVGGVCLNAGCIPLKSLLHFSTLNDSCNSLVKSVEGEFSFNVEHSSLVNYNGNVISILRDSIEKFFKHYQITIVKSMGKILKSTDTVIVEDISHQIYEGKKLIIATGASSRKLDFCSDKIIYSEDALFLDKVPKRIVIIGAGAVGLEFADYFVSKKSEVTVIEKKERIGNNIDDDIASILQKRLMLKGIKFFLNTSDLLISNNELSFLHNNNRFVISDFDKILIAVGRVPNVVDIGLENTFVKLSKNGFIEVDENLKTFDDNIFACGDVVGRKMLAHTAYKESRYIVDYLTGNYLVPINYNSIPSVIYTSPELGVVGLTEDMCKDRNISYKIISIPLTYSSRYYIENGKGASVLKLIIDDDTVIIGVEVVGGNVSELITLAEIFVEKKYKISEIQDIVYPHPSVCEIFSEIVDNYYS